MVDTGRCSLIIRGSDLPLIEIQKNIPIEPSKIILKGDKFEKYPNETLFDLWILDLEFENSANIDETLNKLLTIISPYTHYFRQLSSQNDVIIRIYIQSDYAEIGWQLHPDTIQKLAATHLELEFSVLSWGGVEGEE